MDIMTANASAKAPYREMLSSIDRTWLRMDSQKNPMVINAVLTFASAISYRTLVHYISSKFAVIPRFRCAIQAGTLADIWQEVPVDTDYHFPLIANAVASDTELQQLATDFVNQPLASERPRWRMLCIPQFKRGSALVVRIHHAYADGMALVRVLLQLMDEGALWQQPTAHTATARARPHPLQRLLTQPTKLLAARELLTELTSELLTMGLLSPQTNPLKSDCLCGVKQLHWSPPLPLAEVKALARCHQVKVNDVLLNSVAGALRNYLASQQRLSAWSELRALIPVDLRGQHSRPQLGNCFGLVLLALPLGIADPVARTRALHQRMKRLKNSRQAWLIYQLLQIAGHFPERLETELIRLFSDKATTVVTNVPGPAKPLHLAGRALEQILFWVPQAGTIGTGISILTYNNRVQFGLMSDQQLIAQPSTIAADLNTQFSALNQASRLPRHHLQ